MAGNYPFHSKLHRSAHHTLPTPGILESATDPIASEAAKFKGIFYTLSQGSSLDWYNSFLTVQAISSVYLTVRALSGTHWESVYNTVYSLSDGWEESLIISPLQVASAGWQSNYITTNSNSAYWTAAYTNLVTNSSSFLSGGAAEFIQFYPITTTNYFSARIEPLQLLATNVQSAISALHDRINAIYALLNGLTATKGTLFVSISSTL